MILFKQLPGILVFNPRSLESIAERRAAVEGTFLFCLGFLAYALVRHAVYAVLPGMALPQQGMLWALWNLNLIQTLLFLLLIYIPVIIVLSNAFSGYGTEFEFSRREYQSYAAVLMPVWGMIALISAPLQLLVPHFLLVGVVEISLGMLGRILLIAIYTFWIIRRLNRFAVMQASAVFLLSWLTLPVYYLMTSWPPAVLFVTGILVSRLLWQGLCRLSEARSNRYAFQQNSRRLIDDPQDMEAHYRLGELHLKRGNLDAARGYFEKALRIEPDNPVAHFFLGRVHTLTEEWSLALRHYEATRRIDPGFSRNEILRETGKCCLHAGETGKAVEALERFVAQRGDDPEGRYWLATALGKTGDRDMMIYHLNVLLEQARAQPGIFRKQNREWIYRAGKAIRDARVRIRNS
jgi:tetratricopeptide (TPR) repeat protein